MINLGKRVFFKGIFTVLKNLKDTYTFKKSFIDH